MAATEELKIKISVDNTDVQSKVNQTTSSLKKLGKEGGSSFGMSADAAAQLHDSLSSIKNMSFTGMVSSIANLGTQWKLSKAYLKEYNHHAQLAKAFLDKNSWVYNGKSAIAEWEGEAAALENYKIQMGLANDEMAAGEKQGGALFTVLGKGAAGAVIGIAAVATELLILVGVIRSALRLAPQIKQIAADAAKIGMSVQAYQQWGYIFESVGVQADELTGLIKTLSDEQAQMAEGSEGASKAFQALGLSVNDVVNMGQEQLFTETIMRLNEVESGVKRTQLAYQIFGEDASHVANIMNMNNEQLTALINNYNQLGGGASQALVNKSKELSFSVGQLKQAWTGLTNALAETVMPVLTAVVNWLTKAIAIVRMFIQAIFGLDSTPAASSSSSMASGMSSYAAATNSATKAVQKLKREQMGFDELNKLPGNETSSGSGLDSGGGGFGGGLGGGFELPKIEDLGLDKWQAWFTKYKNIIQDITTVSLLAIGVIGAVMCFMGGNWLGGIALLGVAGLGLAVGSVEGGTFDRLIEKIKEVWKNLKDWFVTNVAPKFTKEYWVSKFEPIRTAMSEKMDGVKTAISTKWQGIKDWFNTNVAPKFTKQYWLTKLDTLRAAATEKLNSVKTAFSTAWTNIKGVFSNWSSFFTGLWDKVKSIFKSVGTSIGNSVAGAVKSVINSILGTIESKVNSFITMINNAITIINKIPGVNISKLSKISIPRLATGGIVTGSTIANIGEAGAEAVLPLENNTQWMDMLADRIAARNGSPSKIVLSVDGKELGWASINGINSITDQTGNLQLRLV